MNILHRYLAEEVAEDLADGIITRREAMRRLGLMGLTAGALWLLGVPLAFTLGLIAGVFNFIPNIGFVLGLIPPAVLIPGLLWLWSKALDRSMTVVIRMIGQMKTFETLYIIDLGGSRHRWP